MKILVILTYFERPELVKRTIQSILEAGKKWEEWGIAFIDDGSQRFPGRPIVEKVLGSIKHHVSFYNTMMTEEMKKEAGGSCIGHFMNKAALDLTCDIIMTLGDDDEIDQDCFLNLGQYFLHSEKFSCYFNARVFDPIQGKPDRGMVYSELNDWKGHEWFGKEINPSKKVDGIQVAVRKEVFSRYGARFPFPCKINHDAEFLQQIYERTGPVPYAGFTGVAKGKHGGQLIERINKGERVFSPGIDKKRSILMF